MYIGGVVVRMSEEGRMDGWMDVVVVIVVVVVVCVVISGEGDLLAAGGVLFLCSC